MAFYYKGILDRIGLGVRSKRVEIPDYKLMIGSAEQLSSVPLLLYNDLSAGIPKPLLQNIENMKHEDVQEKLANGSVTIDDFVNNTWWLGNAVDGG